MAIHQTSIHPVSERDYRQVSRVKQISEYYRKQEQASRIDAATIFASKKTRALVRERAWMYEQFCTKHESTFEIWTCKVDDEVVGFVESSAYGSVYAIYVHPMHRRKGIGSRLIQAISERYGALRMRLSDIDHRKVSPWFIEFLSANGFRLMRLKNSSRLMFRKKATA